MSQVPVSQCPALEALQTFASGTLDEQEAEAVVAHLDECPTCQQRVDSFTPRGDSLIRALRGTSDSNSDDASKLNRLMQAAVAGETIAANSSKTKQTSSTGDTVNLETFVAGARRSGLLPADDLQGWLDELQPSDARGFAKALVKRNHLTRFQAQALLQGRHQHLVLGNYEVLEPLGEGGMGRVFKARHRQLRRIVCLKVLHAADRKSPHIVERFRREAETVAALSHPNIVVAHDADDAEGIPYLAMEFIEGQDLAKHVEENGRFSPCDAVQILLQAARALEYAHGQGVVHRDVKPSNMLLASEAKDSSGELPLVKVLDLGLARFDSLLSDNPDALTHTSMTSTGVVMGTVDYLSPEQAMNSRKADRRSDIYSLGCTLYFLVTGRVVYTGETVMEKLIAHRERAVPSLIDSGAEVPASLDAIFQQMVAKDPADRYQSMSLVARDLEIFLEGGMPRAMQRSQTPVVVEPLPLPDSRLARRQQAIAMSIGAAAVLLVMLVGGWMVASTDWQKMLAPVVGTQDREAIPDHPTVEHRPDIQPIAGHADTFANNGDGRVLLVVPHGWFYDDHYQQITTALKNRNVAYEVASSTSEAAKPKHGAIPPVAVDLTLDQVNLDDFDAICFLGGNVHEFTHKNPTVGEQAKAIISDCLDKGRVVAAIGNGWDVVKDSGQCKACQIVSEGVLHTGKPEDGRPGTFVKTDKCGHADQLVDRTIAALRVGDG